MHRGCKVQGTARTELELVLLGILLLLRSCGIALLLLLLHLLLHLLLLQKLALLHLLHNLLRCAHGAAWAVVGLVRGLRGLWNFWLGRFRLLRLFYPLIVLILRLLHLLLLRIRSCLGRACSASTAGREDDLARGAASEVSGKQYVVTGTLEQLHKDVARLAGTVAAEDSLVGYVAYDLGAGVCGDFGEDLLEAGVGGTDAETAGVPHDGRRIGTVIDGPAGHGRRWRGLRHHGSCYRLFRRTVCFDFCDVGGRLRNSGNCGQKNGGRKHQILRCRGKVDSRLRPCVSMHGNRLGGRDCVRRVTAATTLLH